MSVEVSAVKTTEPPRAGQARWGRVAPYLVLISVVALVVAFSIITPEPVVEISIPRPSALSESDGHQLRGGFWDVEEMWLGSKLEFSEQQEIAKGDQASDRFYRGERPVAYQGSTRRLRITSNQTFEITSLRYDVSGMSVTNEYESTEMVYITRFDPEGMGTVNALPIAWNEEKADVLKKLDAGESLKGLYEFNGNLMQVYFPGDTQAQRPAVIPKTLSSQDRLFMLRRIKGIISYPECWAELHDGHGQDLGINGVHFYIIPDDGRQRKIISVPLTTPIRKAVDHRRTGEADRLRLKWEIVTFCHTNGWIVQTLLPYYSSPRWMHRDDYYP